MKFIKVADQSAAISYLEGQIRSLLKQNLSIAWFVSGGSNLPITIGVIQKLSSEDLSNLTVLLADERFGPYNHINSNALEFQEPGLLIDNVKFVATIIEDDSSFEDTVSNYQKVVESVFEKSDYILGQLGMGGDGHTAGILPNTAATKPSDKLVFGYQAEDYQRITLTFEAIKRMNCVDLFALGASKSEKIKKLQEDNLNLSDFPAAIVKEVPDSNVINEVIGDTV
jgi:6-phosphogluconolactonase/glucosamine-6-phosphate isomerase/deaminase